MYSLILWTVRYAYIKLRSEKTIFFVFAFSSLLRLWCFRFYIFLFLGDYSYWSVNNKFIFMLCHPFPCFTWLMCYAHYFLKCEMLKWTFSLSLLGIKTSFANKLYEPFTLTDWTENEIKSVRECFAKIQARLVLPSWVVGLPQYI